MSVEVEALHKTEEEEEGGIPWGVVGLDATSISSAMSSTTIGCSESSTSPAKPRAVNWGSWVREVEGRPPSTGESRDSTLTSG